MPRIHWPDLPVPLRAAIERRSGTVRFAESASTGASCDLATALHTDAGTMFCKGIRADNPQARLRHTEARINPWLPADVVPRLRWQLEQDGWLLLGFDYAPGRHPNLVPDSPDLPAVTDALTRLSLALTPCQPTWVQRFADRWAGRIAPGLVDGPTLLHTDVTPQNFLLADRARVVDWAAPCRGAAWIDAALMIVRLVRAGHEPEQAEAWAKQLPSWADARPVAVTAFVSALVALWQERQRTAPAEHRAALLNAVRSWAAYRA